MKTSTYNYRFFLAILIFTTLVSCRKINPHNDGTGAWEFAYVEKQGIDITNVYTENPGYFLLISYTEKAYKNFIMFPKSNKPCCGGDEFRHTYPEVEVDNTTLSEGSSFHFHGFINKEIWRPQYAYVTKLNANAMHLTVWDADTIYKFELNKIMDGGKNFYLGN